jgi:prophage antirepressor-like protein
MNELKLFQSPIFGKVRTVVINGQVMFAATDVAKCLGYANPQKAVRDHCKSAGVNEMDTPTNGGIQKVKFITKGNIIRLVASSELPQAEEVESWIFDEVIPTVLETGGYIATKQDDTPEEIMARALIVAQETIKRKEERLKQLEEKNAKLQPKAEFAEAAFKAEGKVDIGQAAKILNLGYGRNTLFGKLRDAGIFFKDRNEPKQKYIDAGYFEMTLLPPIRRDNHPDILCQKVFCKPKGLAYINHLFGGKPSDRKISPIK